MNALQPDKRRWSYTSGTSDTPLLGLTIGDLFDQTADLPRSASPYFAPAEDPPELS